MIVICLEGCHACGKTELCNKFEREGFQVLDEGFLDMPRNCTKLHPQSLTMETFWVCSWFQRVLAHASGIEASGKSHRDTIFVADRSPLSAVFYSKHGELLLPLIREQIKEIKAAAGIEIVTAHVNVEDQVLWQRIQARLQLEPERAELKEDTYEWMTKVKRFYKQFSWDIEVDNTEDDPSKSLNKLMHMLLHRFCRKSERFETALRLTSPKIHAVTKSVFDRADKENSNHNCQALTPKLKHRIR
mmetsp:Transcript_3637/g.4362  ORF Transcript_3637/g.4362 Transcript_3637/m.4362 type:complete len:245 (-) Transcript_3637:2417-3151(-)